MHRLRFRDPAAARASARALLLFLLSLPLSAAAQERGLARQVEIRRTAYGVPHLRAESLRAAGFGLGYVQMEDYGLPVARGLVAARGELGLHLGPDSLEGDFLARLRRRRALESYHLLHRDTRDVLEGFAAGVNRYIETHPAEFPAWVRPDFTGHDVHARTLGADDLGRATRLAQRMARGDRGRQATPASMPSPSEEGSNVWAFAPRRTRSGRAILMRNPHLSWTAGYHEAQVTVPGKLNFYGDFRIGGPLVLIGGFNQHLGWSTTNNDVDADEVYALDADPRRPDHYLFDGASVPLRREEVTVEFRNGDGVGRATREFWLSPLGPVVHREGGKVYVLRSADAGEHRGSEQFLRMMQARTLEEWKEAMRMRARGSSNFTYADARGNIFYVWNATLPHLPHAPGGDSVAIRATRSDEVWTRLVPWDSLPQLLNPRGGYLHNENDSPHYTNLNQPLDPARYPPNVEQPRLRLRSQHALELVHGSRRVSLEEVVEMKHSMRMLLADRVKPDLIAAVRASSPAPEVAAALRLLEGWDNTAAAGSRGGVLFETWWRRYTAGADADTLYAEPWTPERPTATPRGLRFPERAAAAFAWAVEETRRRHGAWDVAWGDVHRVRRGSLDLPVGGCSGFLGCFRVLTFRDAPDGKRVVDGGDGWVLAVEFGDTPRAYSVLAYGESDKPESPHHADQAELFATGRMKPVAFTEADIERQTIRRYFPGEEVAPSPAPR